MTQAVETLMTEHRLIEKVLGSLATFSEGLEPGQPGARENVAEYAEFFREFADRCHHGKEEDRLFTVMGDYGFPSDTGPVYVMLQEHELGRSHVRELADVGGGRGPLTTQDVETVRQHAQAFIPLLASHIQKEDGILYPAAERTVPAPVLEELAGEFEEFDRTVMGEGENERLHELARRLIERFRPPMQVVGATATCTPCGS